MIRVSARFENGPLHRQHRIVDGDEYVIFATRLVNAEPVGELDCSRTQGEYRYRVPTVNPRVFDWTGWR